MTTNRSRTHEKNEPLFKQKLIAAKWVPANEALRAAQMYEEILKKHKDQIINEPNAKLKIIPRPVQLKAIESFVTNPDFEEFWIKAGDKNIMAMFGGMFITIFQASSDPSAIRFRHPKITKSERDQRIKKGSKLFRQFLKLMNSDASTIACFERAFHDAVPAGFGKGIERYAIGTFMSTMLKSLEDEGPNGCRRMKTHANYPRNLREKNKAERVYFINQVSFIVKLVYGKYNHKVATKILNTIRPDLGPFTESNVGKSARRGSSAELL